MPLGLWITFGYELEGAAPEPEHAPQLNAIVASPEYFDVLRVKARLGRVFTNADARGGIPVVLVNESFTDKFWPRQNVLGQRLRLVTVVIVALCWAVPERVFSQEFFFVGLIGIAFWVRTKS